MKNFLRKDKLMLWLRIIIIIIIIFVAISYLFVNYQKQMAIKSAKEDLQLLANEKAARVNMFLEFQKEKTVLLSSVAVFKETLLYPDDASKTGAAKDIIIQLKEVIPGIRILTKEGIMIVGDINSPGTDYSAVPVFPVNDKTVPFFTRYYDPLRKKDYYAVGGLIYANQGENKIIGVIGFDVELDKISALMGGALEGKSDEIYLIDDSGLLLSNSKYIGQGNKRGVLVQKVKSEGARECLGDLKKYRKEGFVEKHGEEIPEYLNYMGNEVYGAHAYVPAIMGCVIAEKSVDEITVFSLIDYIKNIFKEKIKDEDED